MVFRGYSLKKCTLPFTNFVFKCPVSYFGLKRGVRKGVNTFSLAENILKSSGNFFTDSFNAFLLRFVLILTVCSFVSVVFIIGFGSC